MPLVRYQLRDAHGASDPALYSSNGRDDPQAILQGLAAAGLTGVLRQLGDLADFAAEIFHDLHKDVMCVVARGQGLSLRVRQIETGLPVIEKDGIPQSNCVKLAYSAGISWHPCFVPKRNLITQAEMPKAILDSYEESRGPPRLFKLDKFDSAGAGACTRRYTDPSFFKRSSFYSGLAHSEYQTETKVRKAKVNFSRQRNDELADFTLVSDINFKLHQALSERLDNISGNHRRLKIRPPGYANEYSEDSEKDIVESCRPDQELDNGNPSNNQSQNDEALHAQTEEINKTQKHVEGESNAIDDNDQMKSLPATFRKAMHQEQLGPSTCQANESPMSPNSPKDASFLEDEEHVGGSSDGYLSADISSDMETISYIDALTTSDSEHEVDTETRLNTDEATMNMHPEFIQDLDNSSGHTPSGDIDGLMPVLYVDSTEVSMTVQGLESSDGSTVRKDPILDLGKNGNIDVSSASTGKCVPDIAMSNLGPELESEGTGGFPQAKNARDSLFPIMNDDEDSSLLLNLTISEKSRGSLSLSSMPPLPGSTLSAVRKNRAQSLELCGGELNVGFSSSPEGMMKVKEDVPPLPPLPPAEWRTGKFQGHPSFLGGAGTRKGSTTRIPKGEHSPETSEGDGGSSSIQVLEFTNSESCYPVSKALEQQSLVVEVQSPALLEKMLELEEVAYHSSLSHLEIVQPVVSLPTVASSMEDLNDGCGHDCENNSLSLNRMEVLGVSCVGNKSESKTLQPPTNEDAISLCLDYSQGVSPSSAINPPHTLAMNGIIECSSTQEPGNESSPVAVRNPAELEVELSNEKLSRPPDALIEAVATHDKSRLRKVSKVIQISNMLVTDQRSALLDEIRNKAFTLRPASLARPSIKGPSTNLKYAAILEKASNIRQALAGSDEEDEDGWD